MKLTITNSQIKPALTLAAQFAQSNSTMPILTHILFKQGQLIAGDGSAQITINAPVEGDFAAPADKLRKIIAAFPDDAELAFDVKEKLTVKSGKSKLSMAILSGRDFPLPKLEGEVKTFTIAQAELKRHIQNVIHAMPSNHVHMWMNSIIFNGAYVAATSGQEIGVSDLGMELPVFALPAKYASLLIKLLGDGDVAVSVYWAKAVFALDGIEFICPILAEKIPDITKAVPTIKNEFVQFDREEFLQASARAMINANKFMGASISVKDGEMHIECKDSAGTGEASLPVAFNGPDFEFGYNIEQLRAAVNAVGESPVRLHIGGNVTGTAMVVSADGRVKAVSAPMRV